MGETIKNKEVEQQLEIAKKEGANLLMPSMQIAGLSEWHAPVLERVTLSAKPEEGDVYPHDDEKDPLKKKWRLTKQALMKLSVCGGVIWSAELCKRVDDCRNRDYICYQAVGGIRKADGAPVFFKAQYDLDFEVIEEELREEYEKKAKWLKKSKGPDERPATGEEKKEYVEYCTRRDLLRKRKHGLKLAEAGAMNRVIREIFGLKQAYTATELAKPFVMARIVFRPDYSDRDVKKALIEAHVKAMTGIYGPAVAPESAPREAVIDVTPTPEEPENGKGEGEQPTSPDPQSGSSAGPPPMEALLFDFSQFDHEGKAGCCERVAARKGYDLKGYLGRSRKALLTQLTEKNLTDLYKHLLGLTDKREEEESIPF